jgi:hypothetical protein
VNEKELEKAMRIFNDNESVNKQKFELLEQIEQPTCEMVAINSSAQGRATASQQFGGPENSTHGKKGFNTKTY